MIWRALVLAVATPALVLSACARVPQAMPDAQRLVPVPVAMPVASAGPAPALRHSNADLAQDFLELSFRMESGRAVPQFTRFEGPVTVALVGDVPPSVLPDLERLLSRLRSEAGIRIARVDGRDAGINIEFLTRAKLQAVVPQAACFVVPNVRSWSEFRRARNTEKVDWTRLSERTHATVFIPNDTSPQEMRDCLHEEIAQALGPLNDLYRLTDSIFNDDNFQTVLTPFDMMMLRITYAPELRSGMGLAEVSARLPGILARINPAGRGGAAEASGPTPREWVSLIEQALASRASHATRRDAARRALSMAKAQGWQDGRMAFSLFVLARLLLNSDTEAALRAFAEAGALYRGLPGAQVQAAHIDLQLAAFALAANRPEDAFGLTSRALLSLSRADNAALNASLMLIKSEALDQLGRPSEAKAVRLDSRGYARYGFGADAEIAARQLEVAALSGNRGQE